MAAVRAVLNRCQPDLLPFLILPFSHDGSYHIWNKAVPTHSLRTWQPEREIWQERNARLAEKSGTAAYVGGTPDRDMINPIGSRTA